MVRMTLKYKMILTDTLCYPAVNYFRKEGNIQNYKRSRMAFETASLTELTCNFL